MTTWTLHGSGRQPATTWTTLHTITPHWHTAWADPAGFHHTTHLPTTPPTTTHLWAWAPHHWLRVRIDHHHWWAALLTTTNTTPHWPHHTTINHIDITPLRNWHHNPNNTPDHRIAHYRGTPNIIGHHNWTELTPRLPHTAQFITHNTNLPHP
ncbi:hypothetical protein GCM10023148_12230 [Actinokineospora soli]